MMEEERPIPDGLHPPHQHHDNGLAQGTGYPSQDQQWVQQLPDPYPWAHQNDKQGQWIAQCRLDRRGRQNQDYPLLRHQLGEFDVDELIYTTVRQTGSEGYSYLLSLNMSPPLKAQSSGSAAVLRSKPGSGSLFIGLVNPFAAGYPAKSDAVPSILATAGGRRRVSCSEEKSCPPSVSEAILLSSSSSVITVWSANRSQTS
jgi:hypothetical protein